MKATELKEKSVEELRKQLSDSYKERFEYRMQQSTGQLAQTHLIKAISKDIARIKTVLNEKSRSGQ